MKLGLHRHGMSVAVLLGGFVAACAGEPLPPDLGNNLILITLDGMRAREVFFGPDPALAAGDTAPTFPLLFDSLTREGVIFGDPRRAESMTTTNDTQVSIPGYMSIFTGFEQPCYDNDCPRVRVETVLEYVQRQRQYGFGEIAVFASWEKIGRALEHVVGAIYTDIGPSPGMVDVPTAWPAARWDRDTFAAAMAYLESHRPRLLYIALLDGDAWGHARRYPDYLATLRTYDGWIAELRDRLATMGEYGARTTVMVTTDHGRGDGVLSWHTHNNTLPGSERVWLYAVGAQVAHGIGASASQPRSSGDLRPTIETIFGLPPSTCVRCGVPIPEVLGEPQ